MYIYIIYIQIYIKCAQWLCRDIPAMNGQWHSSDTVSVNGIIRTRVLFDSLLVLTLTMRELRHWPSIVGMSLQSHCGDEEDGCIGLFL